MSDVLPDKGEEDGCRGPPEVMGMHGWGGVGGVSAQQVPCAEWVVHPHLPCLFASTGQIEDLGKSSQLGLVQGAERAPGLWWYLGTPPTPGGSRKLWEAPLPIPWGYGGPVFLLP